MRKRKKLYRLLTPWKQPGKLLNTKKHTHTHDKQIIIFHCHLYSQIFLYSSLFPPLVTHSPFLFCCSSAFPSLFLILILFSFSVSRASAPPFLVRSRPQAVRITSRALTLFFQGEALLSQLQVIGGNKTGVFVHHVTEGSPAQSVGISPGAQILEVCVCVFQLFQ